MTTRCTAAAWQKKRNMMDYKMHSSIQSVFGISVCVAVNKIKALLTGILMNGSRSVRCDTCYVMLASQSALIRGQTSHMQ